MRSSPIIALALLAAACSKPSGNSAESAAPGSSSAAPTAPAAAPQASAELASVPAKYAHPCQILQRADAEAVLHTKTLEEDEHVETRASGAAGDAVCVWKVPGGGGFAKLQIHIPTHKDRFDHSILTERAPVPGIGDKAYLQTKTKWGHVDVLKGDQTFFVQVENGSVAFGHSSDATETMHREATDLAKTIAPRM